MICSVCNTEFDGDACPGCGAPVSSTVKDRLAVASALIGEGLYDQAIEALDQAVASDPRSYEAHSLLGAAYLRTGDPELAGHHFERAVWLDSGRAAARYNLAVAYRAAGRVAEAAEQARAALAKDPSHAKAKSLLKELERSPREREPQPGSPANRRRAAAPHLAPVHVRGARLGNAVLIALATLFAGGALVGGASGYAWAFRLLTSPQLAGRDALLWSQMPYAFGAVMFVAGVIAASWQAPGLPVPGFAAGLVAAPVGIAVVLGGEGIPMTARIAAGAAVAGAVGVGAAEAVAKFTRLGEYRRTLLWVSIAGMLAYVMVGYLRQGSLNGYVTRTSQRGHGRYLTARVPEAQILLRNPRTKLTYAAVSQRGDRDAAARGSYRLRGVPVGDYMLTAIDPRSGASWQGDVYVDYGILRGNELEISLTEAAQQQRVEPGSWPKRMVSGPVPPPSEPGPLRKIGFAPGGAVSPVTSRRAR